MAYFHSILAHVEVPTFQPKTGLKIAADDAEAKQQKEVLKVKIYYIIAYLHGYKL